ncbi:MAG: terpene cyclase/mutase family protein [Thermoguttaceae bacterium]|nr:terpene cyclase/mutase family protein [Thermoguttaceae bacterium]
MKETSESKRQTVAMPSSADLREAIRRSQEFFFSQQNEDGHWRAELEGDALLEGEAVILLTFLGQEDSLLAKKLANHLLLTQSQTGGWPMFTGGEDSITNTVKAYFALKLTGHPLSAPYMQRAREAVMRMGGADNVNSFTRFYLALLGQIPYEQCPAVPPELILLPKWFPINMYAVSSWTRTIIAPLAIVSALRPVRYLPVEKGIRELFHNAPEQWPPLSAPKVLKPGQIEKKPGFFSWERFFRMTDVLLKKYQRWFGKGFIRKRAITKMNAWLLEHCKNSDGPGAIQPPIIWGLVAMKAQGRSDDSPEVQYFLNEFHKLIVDDGVDVNGNPSAHGVPCLSPIWDTVLTLRALAAGGIRIEGDSPASKSVRKALEWLLPKQHTWKGDWAQVNPNTPPGGWAFEYHNDFYPDCDDSAMAIMAIHELSDALRTATLNGERVLPAKKQSTFDNADNVRSPEADLCSPENLQAAIDRCVTWLIGMQNKDGGWASFDKNNNRQFLCHVPFADHNAMIDPSTTDITGRILEALGALGYRCSLGNREWGIGNSNSPEANLKTTPYSLLPTPSIATCIDRAIAFCRKEQLPDGSWFGRWGANYIYGTGEALNGLAAVGVDPKDPMVAAGVNWLKAHQHSDGGWGETLDSYRNPLLKGTGNTTASQTAWALLGLIASGEGASESVVKGIRYLLDHQDPDGQWSEPEFTGTGFPLVFYLRYHYYRNYFPLKALSDWESRFTQEQINALFAPVENRVRADESIESTAPALSDDAQPDDQASSLRRLVQGRFDNMNSARRFALIAAETSAAVTEQNSDEDDFSDSPRLKLYVG